MFEDAPPAVPDPKDLDAEGMLDRVQEILDDPARLLEYGPVVVILGFVGVVILWKIVRRFVHVRRRRGAFKLHPRMEPYAGVVALSPEIRALARQIRATSSTAGIIGYEIVQQIEAVHVDGFAKPEDALDALKAAAAAKGANSLTNVRHFHGERGRHGASGDAVIARMIGPAATPQAAAADSSGPEAPRADSEDDGRTLEEDA